MSLYDIKEVSKDELSDIFDSYNEDTNKYDELGMFLCKDGDTYIVCDNSDGNAWTEEFPSRYLAEGYLNGDFEMTDYKDGLIQDHPDTILGRLHQFVEDVKHTMHPGKDTQSKEHSIER